MRLFALVLLAFLPCAPVVALDFMVPNLIDVIGAAEAVVRIKKSEIPINDVEAEVVEVIRGSGLQISDNIVIKGEGSWYAETPLAPVQDYSDEILFLRRIPESDAWRIVGPLGIGRMIVRDGYAYLGGFQSSIPRYSYHCGEPALQRLKLTTLLQADRDLQLCLEWNEEGDDLRPRLLCSMTELEALKERSDLHRLLVNEVAGIRAKNTLPQ